MGKTAEQQVQDRLEAMPVTCRGVYQRAMTGKSRGAAVKAFCLECVGWNRKSVRDCTSPACPMFLYRPFRKLKDGV